MKRLRAIVAACAALALGLGALVWHARKAPFANGFAFCAARGSEPVAAIHVDEMMFSAAALSLTDEERARLDAILRDANARWEARANPLLEDLGEGDPDDELRRWLDKAPPPVRTALAASSVLFCGGDGFCVAPLQERGRLTAPLGDPNGTASCAPGFERLTSKADVERARFLAWPFGYALWLRADTADAAKFATESIRARARASRWIGLVLCAGDAHRAGEPGRRGDIQGLHDRYAEHEALVHLSRKGRAGANDDHGEAPRFQLDARDVMVLPRLVAITSMEAFEAEVRAAAPALRVLR